MERISSLPKEREGRCAVGQHYSESQFREVANEKALVLSAWRQ